MKKEQPYKDHRREERLEREKKYERTVKRNWIIGFVSLAIIVLATIFSNQS